MRFDPRLSIDLNVMSFRIHAHSPRDDRAMHSCRRVLFDVNAVQPSPCYGVDHTTSYHARPTKAFPGNSRAFHSVFYLFRRSRHSAAGLERSVLKLAIGQIGLWLSVCTVADLCLCRRLYSRTRFCVQEDRLLHCTSPLFLMAHLTAKPRPPAASTGEACPRGQIET